MEKEKFLAYMQQQVAYQALEPKSLDFQQEGTVLQDLRTFTSSMDLDGFATEDPDEFHNQLEGKTEELEDYMSAERKNWGTARTAINLMLNHALYNRYLSQSYDLYLAEHNFEYPLNKTNVEGLRRHEEGSKLPEWSGLTVLKHEHSQIYQKYAAELAENMGVSRIHLSLFIWTGVQV